MMDKESMTVMLVDDDPNLQETLGDILKAKGIESLPVETGAAALARIEQQDIDVALIDLKLEDMPGLEVLRGIKQRSPNTECILLTGHASQASAIEAINQGAYSFFQKPYDVEQLLIAIQHAGEKRKGKESLQNNEKRLRALIEIGRDNISLLAADGTLLWESPSTDSTLGYAPDQFLGRNMFELIHPDDQGWTRELFAQMVQTPGRSQDGIFRLRHSDGTWRWIESTTSNMLNEPSVRAIVINYRDITERKQTEEALHKSDAQYRLLANNISDVIWILDLETGRFTYVSPSVEQLRGYTVAEVLAQDTSQALTSDSSEHVQKVIPERIQAAEQGQRGSYLDEVEQPRKDGTTIWTETTTHYIFNAQNGHWEVYGVSRDITERKRAEAKLAASEAELRTLFAAMTDVVIVYDADGRYLKIAPTNLTNFYRPLNDMLGKTVHDILPKEQADYIVAKIGEAIQTGRVVTGEYALEVVGKEMWFASNASRLSENTVIWVAHDITERKQAEESLRASEQKFRSFIEQTGDAAVLTNESGAIIQWNQGAEHIFGQQQAKVLGQFLWDIQSQVVPEHRKTPQTYEQLKTSILEALKTGRGSWLNQLLDATIQRSDGVCLTVQMLAFPIQTKSGFMLGSISRDITKQKRAEEALRESEKKYQVLTEVSPVGIFRTDAQGTTTYVNPRWSQISGLSADEALGDGWLSAVHPEDRDKLSDGWKKAISAQTASVAEYRFVCPDGSITWVLGQSTPEKNIESQVVGYVGTITDITERKQAEEKLKDSEKRFATIFRANPAAIAITRTDNGQLVNVNEAWTEATGYTETEAIGHTPFELNMWVDPGQRARLMEILQQHAKARGEIQLRGKSGEIRDMLMSAELIQLTGETYLLTMAQDITERKQAEDALRESEEKYGLLVNQSPYGISIHQDGQVVFANPASVKLMLAKNEDELLGKPINSFVAPENWEATRLRIIRMLQGESGLYPIEDRYVRLDGSVIPVEVIASSFIFKGRPAIQVIAQDITERKQAEGEIKKQLDELQRWHAATLGRETRILDLKREVNELLGKTNQPPRYPSAET
jgi:PAS domain S-box-containing protein